jgi:hypothetical protein
MMDGLTYHSDGWMDGKRKDIRFEDESTSDIVILKKSHRVKQTPIEQPSAMELIF